MASFNADTTADDVIKHLANEAHGKTFVITGTSEGGIGAETAISLASARPKQIILASRNEAKVTPVIDEIMKANSTVEITFVEMNLADNSSVRNAAAKIKATTNKIDKLINNAGSMGVETFSTFKDGIETQFATNHIGHFLLTNLLMGELVAAEKGATIVNLSSKGYELAEVNLEDPNFEAGLILLLGFRTGTAIGMLTRHPQDGKLYHPWNAYGQSKTANILFSRSLGKKLRNKGIAAFAVHPGLIIESQFFINAKVSQELLMEGFEMARARNDGNPLPPQANATLTQGAACVLVAALDPSIRGEPNSDKLKDGNASADSDISDSSPAYMVENQIMEPKAYATNKANAEALWKLSEKLVGEKFDI